MSVLADAVLAQLRDDTPHPGLGDQQIDEAEDLGDDALRMGHRVARHVRSDGIDVVQGLLGPDYSANHRFRRCLASS